MIVMSVEKNVPPKTVDMTLGELGSFGIGMSKDEALKHFAAADLDRQRMQAAMAAFPSEAAVLGDVSGMVDAFSKNWNKVKSFYPYGPRAFGAWAQGADESGAWFRQKTKKIFDAVRKGGGTIPEVLTQGFEEVNIPSVNLPRNPGNAFPTWGTPLMVAGAAVIGYLLWKAASRPRD